MKYILELILVTIIIFFLWNTLKRIFFTNFYKFPQQQNSKNQHDFQRETSEKNRKGLNWDAEDADFEEIKEEEKITGK